MASQFYLKYANLFDENAQPKLEDLDVYKKQNDYAHPLSTLSQERIEAPKSLQNSRSQRVIGKNNLTNIYGYSNRVDHYLKQRDASQESAAGQYGMYKQRGITSSMQDLLEQRSMQQPAQYQRVSNLNPYGNYYSKINQIDVNQAKGAAGAPSNGPLGQVYKDQQNSLQRMQMNQVRDYGLYDDKYYKGLMNQYQKYENEQKQWVPQLQEDQKSRISASRQSLRSIQRSEFGVQPQISPSNVSVVSKSTKERSPIQKPKPEMPYARIQMHPNSRHHHLNSKGVLFHMKENLTDQEKQNAIIGQKAYSRINQDYTQGSVEAKRARLRTAKDNQKRHQNEIDKRRKMLQTVMMATNLYINDGSLKANDLQAFRQKSNGQ